MAFIRISLSDGTLMDCQLDAKVLRIGRHPENDVVLQDPSISSRQAELSLEPDGVWVKDLGSTNPTQVNGVNIEEMLLSHRDTLAIGDLKAVFYDAQPDEVDEPPADGENKTARLRKAMAADQLNKLPVAATRAVHLRASDQAQATAAKSPQTSSTRRGRARTALKHWNARKPESNEQIGQLIFLFVIGVFAAVTLGLTLRHLWETGGFLPAEVFEKIRYIEVRQAEPPTE